MYTRFLGFGGFQNALGPAVSHFITRDRSGLDIMWELGIQEGGLQSHLAANIPLYTLKVQRDSRVGLSDVFKE